jgi:hypothetical protein
MQKRKKEGKLKPAPSPQKVAARVLLAKRSSNVEFGEKLADHFSSHMNKTRMIQ